MIDALLQSFQRQDPVTGQVRLADRRHGPGEESGLPFLVRRFPLRCLLSLPLFEFGFQLRGLCVLLVEDCLGDI